VIVTSSCAMTTAAASTQTTARTKIASLRMVVLILPHFVEKRIKSLFLYPFAQ
jgi:hypothetical protein